ncbi:hypothetical protein PMAA_000890 [Talaromyces marneffei ATCC 18224]|uniref:Ubiquitin-like protease family profile domain-containing protein n=1 Tax=Talaromyces marneffei (strain ATCC 18224 / CBS 334.59 / QM 7333) TaxID=441960 RepID=B6QSB1_TALMQ|nr:hypothetical protein PMAA_000890 [Talaromyces marneffei ATCC 18224]
MDSAFPSSRPTIPPSQRRRSLLELSEKLRELADMQVEPEMKDAESVPDFRDLFQHLVQEAPAVAHAIAAAIRENIPDPSPRLSSKRKRRPGPSYRLSRPVQLVPSKRQCINNKSATDEPMAPESTIFGSKSPETEGGPEFTGCAESPEFTFALNHESTPDVSNVRSTTPVMDGENPPLSENIHHRTLPRSPQTESKPVPEENLIEGVSFLDTVYQMVDIVCLLKKHPNDLPRTVHQRILQSLHPDQGPIIDSTVSQWSDGRMWMEVLERGSATNRRCTVLNMLEYIGASKWYDDQIELAKRTVCTKEKKAVDDKGAATHVLNRIAREHSLLSKKIMTNRFSRGKRLRLLVGELGLGILISPMIWDYTKRKEHQISQLIQDFKADTQQMALFQVLTPQVEQLVRCGSTDPEVLYNSLRQHNLVSDEELQELKMKCALEHDPLPNGALNAAYDQLVSRISAHVFNKRRLSDHDAFIIDNSLKLPADIFYALRPGQWLDCWVIKAAMHIADRPAFVHFRESIPVNDIGRHGRMRSIKKPFEAWAQEMAGLRRKAELGPAGHHTPLIFYSPIHHTDSHFTLLEIDDGEKVIRHYDSLAERTTIHGTKKTRIATLVECIRKSLGISDINTLKCLHHNRLTIGVVELE